MSNRRALGHPRWREGFRETFLVVFTRKGDASALRRLTLLLSELYICAAPRWWPYPEGSELNAVLRAVVADLRHLRHVLAWTGGGNTYGMEQSALAHFAGGLGGELEAVAASIEGAMADPKGTLKRQQATSDAAVFIRREVVR
ncbi:MAG TPA: hypothetical protein VIE43_13435 [Thermoanaerobaculia bacterium]|nr:hypothetical protein [Thermoanaerobaculia bacterium]